MSSLPVTRLCIAASALLMTTPLCAQTSIDNAVRQHERAIQELERERDMKPSVDVFMPETPAKAQSPSEQPAPGCFTVREIAPEGHPKDAGEPPDTVLGDFRGRCLAAVDVNALLANLNRWYQERGFITTRAYAPEQNLSTGVLRLKIIPGKIKGFRINEQRVPLTGDSRLSAAFPRGAGEILNLRDLEQGLENINRLPSQEGSFKIFPGEEAGDSEVRLDLALKPRWRLTETAENTGSKTMGQWRGTTELALDNLLGRDDQLALGINTSLQGGTLGGKFKGGTVNWLMPQGYHLFLVSAAVYDSQFTLPGINESYGRLETRTQKIAAGYEYLFHRNQRQKESLVAGLESSRQWARLGGYDIPSQRSQLSVLYLGAKGKYYEGNRIYDWLLRWEHGIDALDAMDNLPGGYNPRYQGAKARLTATVPLFGEALLWRGTLQLQNGDAQTPLQNQLFMGGRYDVRGFQDNSLTGYRGGYLRNDVETKAVSWRGASITPYVGLDGGRVKARDSLALSQNSISGYALGARLEWQAVRADIAWAAAISRPQEFNTDPKHYLYCSVSLTF
jgi:hemolysin activation/secretion protein